jgi:hypothetical protein
MICSTRRLLCALVPRRRRCRFLGSSMRARRKRRAGYPAVPELVF